MQADVQSTKDRVLLVDDEPQILVALEDVLSESFVVFKAESGESALNVLSRERDIAVVITDQRMPRMTGDELLAALAGTVDASRIMVTGFADLSAVIRAVNEGRIFAYVTKPWNADDLRLKVTKAAEHFKLAKELDYERQLLHDLMDNIPDGIYFKDRDLRFLRANRAFASIVGAARADDLIGARSGDLRATGADVLVTEAQELRILEEGTPTLDVLHEYRVGDAVRWVSETKAAIRDKEHRTLGLVGISRDVTERVQTAEMMRRLEEQLLQAQKMEAIGQLAGGVAHDFNNLLLVMQSCAEFVLQDLPEGDQKREDASEILAATRRASALTRQLLAFSRRQASQPKALDLNEVVANIEKMLCRLIGENVDLTTSMSPGLGIVRADPGQMEQVVLNLTVNARDAMPEGGKLTIETANAALEAGDVVTYPGVATGPYVVLAVRDTGTGMDAATQKRIFEPFFTTKEVGKGTGLGLSTVYGIVQQSGGHIRLESELGRGTCFRVYLPRVDATIDAAIPRRPRTIPAKGAGTVLLVEDDEAVRHVAARILRDNGYTVMETRGPSEARAVCAASETIDLLLTDIVMPELSGPKLAEELSSRFPNMRVLYMSGYSGVAPDADRPMTGGASYIEKPFAASALTQKVRETLGQE